MDEKPDAGAIFVRLGEVLRENAGPILGAIAGLVLLNVALDVVSTNGAPIVSGIASLLAQYFLVGNALERRGLRATGNRFGAFWGLNLLSSIAIVLGFLLLVLPGIYLAARWAAASACLLGDDEGVSAALGRSWRITGPIVWPIVGILFVIFVPAFIAAFGLGFLAGLGKEAGSGSEMVGSAVAYVFFLSAIVVSWMTSVAVYSLTHADHDIGEVFA